MIIANKIFEVVLEDIYGCGKFDRWDYHYKTSELARLK